MIALINQIDSDFVQDYKDFVLGKETGQLELKGKLERILGRDQTDPKQQKKIEDEAREKYQKLVDVYNILLKGNNLEEILLAKIPQSPYVIPVKELVDFKIDYNYKPVFEALLDNSNFKTALSNAITEFKEYLVSDENLLDGYESILKDEILNECKNLIEEKNLNPLKIPGELKDIVQECKLKHLFARVDILKNEVTDVNEVKKIVQLKFEDSSYNFPAIDEKLAPFLKKQTKRSITRFRQKIFQKKSSINTHKNITLSRTQNSNINDLIKDILHEACKGQKYTDIIQNHFGYNKLRESFGHKILQQLGIIACPYCNSQFVMPIRGYKINEGTSVEKIEVVEPKRKNFWQRLLSLKTKKSFRIEEKEHKSISFQPTNDNTAYCQLDHFLPKSKHPYLSVSLFNLIPCCNYCNLYKTDNEKPLLNPYFHNIQEKLKFTAPIKKENLDDFVKRKEIKDIDIVSTDKAQQEEIENHLEIFKIKGVYDNHKAYVSELHMKAYIYNESFKQELKKRTENLPFSIDEDDINRLILGNYTNEEDLNKRPLSKLTKDIAEELGLL